MAGYGVLFTIIGDYRDSYGLSETTLGWIIGVGFIVGFIAQIALGPFGDRGGARQMIAIGALANIVGLLMMGFGTTASMLIAGRVISGLAIGATGPAIKRIVIVGSGENLGRDLGRLFSAEVFGFAIGPVISAFLVGPFGIPAPFIVIAVASAFAAIAASRARIVEADTSQISPRFAFDLLADRRLASSVVLGSAAYLMIGAFDSLWDVVHTDLETPEWIANLGIAFFAVPLVLLGPSSGRLAQKHGPILVATVGMTAGAVFMGIYGALGVGVAIFGVSMVHAVSDGLTIAASGVGVGMSASESRQAGAQGVLGGFQALSAGIMAPVTGWLYDVHGQQTAYTVAAVVIIAFVAVGVVLAGPEGRAMKDATVNDVQVL